MFSEIVSIVTEIDYPDRKTIPLFWKINGT